jgi:hypothetical protein
VRFALLFVLVACGKSGTKAKPQGSFDTLKASNAGQPIAIDRAFIKRISPDVYTVVLGAGKGSCEDLLAGADKSKPGTLAFSFTFAKRLDDTFHVTDVWSRDFSVKVSAPGTVMFDGTADKDSKATIKNVVFNEGPFSATGAFTAIGCGEQPATGMGVPKAPKKMKGGITINGRVLDVRGVTVQTRLGAEAQDLPNIRISSSPLDCSGVTLPAQAILERVDGHWTLGGTWFEKPLAAVDEQVKELAFSANSVGKSSDGPTLMMQLSGIGTIGDLKVQLSGTAEAIECVR